MFKTPTPCVGMCSTALGDLVCKGCKRRSYEVDNWNGYIEAQRASIDNRLDDALTRNMKRYFEIVDQKKVQEVIMAASKHNKILTHRSLYSALYEVLRVYRDNVDVTGLGLKQIALGSISEALDAIDSSWYSEATARYNT